jgi:predicted cobalt transporter CbtA
MALNESKIAAAIVGGLLAAFAISVTLLYLALVLVARHIYGAEGPD